MSHTRLIQSNLAIPHYTQTITSAYRNFVRIYDPDFAHQNDSDAWEKIQRDAVIAHAIRHRQRAAAGLNWRMTPASDEPQDKRAAQIMEELISNVTQFAQARTLIAEAIFRGSSYAFIEGTRRPQTITGDSPRTWWVPTHLRHVDRWRFQQRRVPTPDSSLRLIWEFFSITRNEWEPLTNPEWFVRHVFHNEEASLGYGRGLLQSLFFFWRAKEVVLTQGLNGLERWAQGMLIAKIDGGRIGSVDRDNDSIVDEFLDELDKQRTEHTIVIDKGDDIELKDGPGTGHQMVMDILEYLDSGIIRLILASELPTGGGGEVGSLARATEEGGQMESVFQGDRQSLAESLTDSLVRLTWERNRTNLVKVLAKEALPEARMPSFAIVQEKMEDPQQNANVIATLLGAGIPLVKSEVYEKTGFTPPTDEDEVFEGGQEQAGPFGGLPFQAKADGTVDVKGVPVYEDPIQRQYDHMVFGNGHGE